jgi:ribonuclease HIII
VTVGREIVAKYGQSALAKVAKLHFKTTEAILQG